MGRVSAQNAANLISRGPRGKRPHFVNDVKPAKRRKGGCFPAQNAANLISRGPLKRSHLVCDARPAKRLKRGGVDERVFGFKSSSRNARTTNGYNIPRRGDSDPDEDYAMILNGGIDHRDCSADYAEEGGDGQDTDSADVDPQFKLFSESLKVRGRSYAIEWRKYITRYDDIISVDPKEMCTTDKNMADGAQVGKSGTSTMIRPLTWVSGSKRNCCFTEPKSSRRVHTSNDHLEREVNDRNVGKSTTIKPLTRVSGSKRNRSHTEPKSIPNGWLSNLRMDGKSMVYTSKTGEVVRYEEDESRSSDPLEKEDIDRNVIPNEDDDEHSIFLPNLMVGIGKSMVYTSKTGKVVRYEGSRESSSDYINVVDRDQRQGQNRTPYPAMRSRTIGDRSDFKEELFRQLQKPYSREEYDDLLKKASYQRKRDREPDELSRSRKHKSYLDHHLGNRMVESLLQSHLWLNIRRFIFEALKQKIDSVKHDHPKVLNLLRGFFYWLTNFPHADGFVPWLEPSCLAVLPEEEEADK